ncbi:mitochondrial carrier [Aulographum hederae CBS 113979]|uniref:Mitochondrial carrier n=1 Tax=Aulographum hederae CBS 113979 TaxID=1176131 RepID=A0A6G1GLE7_9PEZI|nr:mitochondrial carrier [Aulographum hederae CBS 113979]
MSNTNEVSPLTSIVAGGTAGAVEATLTYPFEFAKTRVQLRSDGRKMPRNPYAVVLKVYREEGLRALYKGCSTLVVGSIGKDAVRFLCFDSIKRHFADPETGTLSPLNNLLSGMTAGLFASITAVTPTERIKTALIDDAKSGHPRFTSPLHCVRVLLAEQGFLGGIYRGFIGTTLKQISATSLRLGSYNIIKDAETKAGIGQGGVTTFANGSAAGILTVYGSQPFDCVKTRAQSAKGEGVMDAVRGIYRDGGVMGFWRGSTMRLGRVILAAGILFTVYEEVAVLVKPVLG